RQRSSNGEPWTYRTLPCGLIDGRRAYLLFLGRSSPKSPEKKSVLTAANAAEARRNRAEMRRATIGLPRPPEIRNLCRAPQRKRARLVGLRLAVDHIGRQSRAAAGERPAEHAVARVDEQPVEWRPADDRPAVRCHGTKPAPRLDVAVSVDAEQLRRSAAQDIDTSGIDRCVVAFE